jgi:iron complex transport system substrate-binding protein
MNKLDRYRESFTDAGGVLHDCRDGNRRRRVVSLVPSLTETFCAVGGKDRLVGCTAFCIYPKGLLKDPAIVKIGGTKTVLREKLLALNPDLILCNLEENTLEDIDFFKSRVECYINGVKTVEDGIESIREVAALIGTHEKFETLATEIEAKLTEIKRESAERLKSRPRPRLLYLIWREPWMAVNGDTFISHHLSTCGAEDVFQKRTERYPVVTVDEIREATPEIVWLPSEPYIFKEKHVEEIRKLGVLPATPNTRVELVDGEAVCWFGVRQLMGLPYTFAKLWQAEPAQNK